MDRITQLILCVSNDARSRIELLSSGVIIQREMRRPRVDDYQSLAREGASAYRRVIVCVSRPRMHS